MNKIDEIELVGQLQLERSQQLVRSSDFNAMANSTFLSPALLRKTRGFVDFGLQINRPTIDMPKAHDRRFDSFNNFPKILSNNKPVRNINFERMKDRDEVVYRDIKCSDSLFEHSQLNLIKKKRPGILHFG